MVSMLIIYVLQQHVNGELVDVRASTMVNVELLTITLSYGIDTAKDSRLVKSLQVDAICNTQWRIGDGHNRYSP
jgi:hypothetical protein